MMENMSLKEMYEHHIANPPTFKDMTEAEQIEWTRTPNANVDDQGFEGCFCLDKNGNPYFHRWIEDEYNPEIEDFKEKVSAMNDTQLEDAWQAQCTTIQSVLMQYFTTHDEALRDQAHKHQRLQSLVDDEIRRRARQ